MTCRSVLPLLETFVDGELSPEKMLEVEQHLADCPRCMATVHLDASLKTTVKQVVADSATPSDGFEARVRAALAAERERRPAGMGEQDRLRILPWRTVLPVAAAAAATLVWAASSKSPEDSVSMRSSSANMGDMMTLSGGITGRVDRLLDELVNHHTSNAMLGRMTDIGLVEQEVGVPVRVPNLQFFGASWDGASVVPLQGIPVFATAADKPARAAQLRYHIGGHRVTVYVYDASQYPLRARLEPRVVNDIPVFVGMRRGYTIAAAERQGVGYAAATDLGDRETAELVASSSDAAWH